MHWAQNKVPRPRVGCFAENRSLREKLANALEGVRQKQEAERQTDRVVRELQVRERSVRAMENSIHAT